MGHGHEVVEEGPKQTTIGRILRAPKSPKGLFKLTDFWFWNWNAHTRKLGFQRALYQWTSPKRYPFLLGMIVIVGLYGLIPITEEIKKTSKGNNYWKIHDEKYKKRLEMMYMEDQHGHH